MNKQIIYLLVITLLALSSSLYAQVTKAIPEETPDVPHFIQLQKNLLRATDTLLGIYSTKHCLQQPAKPP